ncbi:MAG TPA: hypothetical protein VFO29_12480 [Candidatus Rubrimentiphilum sp.]|nr:hypothetical protein [Candidatus Rubrimentiphilum sp.]
MTQADRIEVADRYAKLLQPYAKKLSLTHEKPGRYMLMTKAKSFEILVNGKWQIRKAPFMVAGVVANKSYVSFHLVPVYMFPDLIAACAPELKKRMQGKGCFNFQTYDAEAARGLKALLKAGLDRTKKSPMFKPGTFD